MKLTKLSLVLRILCGVACFGFIEGVNIVDIEQDTVQTSGSTGWRVWADEDMTLRGWLWDVSDLRFYESQDCTGEYYNKGDPIDSGNAGGSWGPERAFDEDMRTGWGGRGIGNPAEFWVGMDFGEETKNVRCVSILDRSIENGAKSLVVQKRESSGNEWIDVITFSDLVPGERDDIPLSSERRCREGRDLLEINMHADTKGEEISVVMKRYSESLQTWAKRKSIRQIGFESDEKTTLTRCIDYSKCYKIIVKDKGGDGICCGQDGEGFYTIDVDGMSQTVSNFEDGRKEITYVGDCQA